MNAAIQVVDFNFSYF